MQGHRLTTRYRVYLKKSGEERGAGGVLRGRGKGVQNQIYLAAMTALGVRKRRKKMEFVKNLSRLDLLLRWGANSHLTREDMCKRGRRANMGDVK